MMGLPRATYDSIIRDVDLPVLCCIHLGLLSLRYPGVRPDTICSIFCQENQYKVIKTHHIHKANMHSYCSRYLSGEDVLDICAEVDFPPCLMMRRMLELLMRLSKQRVSDVLKQPALLDNVDVATSLQAWQHDAAAQQQQQQQGTSSSHRSSNGSGGSSSSRGSSVSPEQLRWRLQADVVRCVHADRSYSPYCDMAKSLAGLEHEALLYQRLEAARVPFWSEQQLRERGLFKTPDALLQVPICIRGHDGAWHIVHWLDSKASFGDDRTHTQQLEGQYSTYVNRYGPGCVIYWFGFIADLASCSSTRGGGNEGCSGSNGSEGSDGSSTGGGSGSHQVEVHLRDDFPAGEDIMQLPRLEVPSHSGAGAAAALS